MITLKFFILVVCLLQAQRAIAFNYAINLERCKESAEDTACFVRGSCLNKTGTDGTITPGDSTYLEPFKPADNMKLEDYYCDVLMQIKALAKKKFHVMIEVSSKDGNLKPQSGITFTQKELLFECKESGKKLQSELKLHTTEYGGGATYSSDRLFCSIVIEEEKPFDELFPNDPYVDHLPTLNYETNDGAEPKHVIFQTGGDGLWKLPTVTCDPSKVTSSTTSKSGYLMHETDTTSSKITCSDPKFLTIVHDGKDIEVADLVCDRLKYTYHTNDESRTEVKISVSSRFEVYCAEKLCTKCDAFAMENCHDAICLPPEDSSAGECMARSCPSGKNWRMSDGSLSPTPATPVNCKQSKKDAMRAGWFMGDDEITGGSCSDRADCRFFSNLDLTCSTNAAPGDCGKAAYSDDNRTISCVAGFDMTDGTTTLANLTCNPATGFYSSDQGKVEKGTNVYCKKQPVAPAGAPSAAMSGGQKAGIAVGIILTIAVIVGVIVCICWRRRRNAKKTAPQSSMANSEDMKTGIATNSKETMQAGGGGTKSQSGSEAPPSTDRPSKEKIAPDSSDVKEKVDKKEEKKVEKKEEISEDKKEKKEEKKEERKVEEKKSKKKPAKITMDMSKRQVPNLKQVIREMEQMKGREPVDLKPNGKLADASDLTTEQIRFAKNPDDQMKHWDETVFQDMLLPVVPILKTDHRVSFLHGLTAFEHHRPGGELECGSLGQFFQVVRRCYEKNLDCLPTWEIINRLVKLLCANLPQKEAANVVDRMRKMMRECGHMLIKDIGFVRNTNRDTPEMLARRELACRILLGAEDPVCLEELRKYGDVNPDDVDLMPMQTVLFSHALNRMGKKEELETRFWEELKKSTKENPKPKDKPYGTLRQHLIYALCSDTNPEAMASALEMIADPKSRKDQSKPAGEFTLTDLMYAYRGATENPVNMEKIFRIFETKTEGNYESVMDVLYDEYTKLRDEKAELKELMRTDILEICHLMAENCTSKARWNSVYTTICVLLVVVAKPGRNDFDSTKLEKRASNLETMLKDKKIVEWIDEALKKAEY